MLSTVVVMCEYKFAYSAVLVDACEEIHNCLVVALESSACCKSRLTYILSCCVTTDGLVIIAFRVHILHSHYHDHKCQILFGTN